jgi:hypothetical protein
MASWLLLAPQQFFLELQLVAAVKEYVLQILSMPDDEAKNLLC